MATLSLSFATSHHFLDERGQRAGFVLLGGFLASFLFIRTSARLMRDPKVTWWPGSVTTKGGLHLHHLVWGIVLMLVSGFLNFVLIPPSPWLEVFAGAFGVGVSWRPIKRPVPEAFARLRIRSAELTNSPTPCASVFKLWRRRCSDGL